MGRRDERIRNKVAGTLVLCSLGLTAGAIAQNAGSLFVDVGQCVGLASDDDRYACYQERVDAALEDIRAETAEPGEGPSRSERIAAAIREVDEPDEIFGTIADLRETNPDRWVITLDNGQIWRTNQAVRFPIRVGDSVQLSASRWGTTYRLTMPDSGRSVQVKRER